MEIVWEVLFLLQANFIVCISGMGRAGVTGGFVLYFGMYGVLFIVCKTLKGPRWSGRGGGGNRDPFSPAGLLPSELKAF